VDRRGFLRASAGLGGVALLGGCVLPEGFGPPVYVPPSDGTPFTLGVASGLHSASEVVLWTRVEPSLADGASTLGWTIASDPTMETVVASGTVEVSAASDHTAKVLVGGLQPDRSYWYRFGIAGAQSPLGRARTLPAAGAVTPLRLAFCSCQNWQSGWYNAWEGIAAEDLDAVVFLGDYIYESAGSAGIGDVRRDPVGESATLETYRAKYRLYRSDPSLRRAHAAHPLVPVWDDHEFKDNFNRYDVEVEDPARAQAGFRAWFEYMPVWPIDGFRIHRSLRWGSVGELFLLDTRQYRDIQADGHEAHGSFVGAGRTIRTAAAPDRSILGASQRAWLLDGLEGAQGDGVAWKLVGNQVMISPLRIADLDEPIFRQLDPTRPRHDGIYLNMDDWDSYLWERDLLLAHLHDRKIGDVGVLTGDVHSFWQASVRVDFDDLGSPFVLNEFVGGSISSTGPGILGDGARSIEPAPPAWSPPFRYVDFRRNGYGVVSVTPDRMTVAYRVCDVKFPGSPVLTSVRFLVNRGDPVPTVEYLNP
jgi:alkaline phosphatase D